MICQGRTEKRNKLIWNMLFVEDVLKPSRGMEVGEVQKEEYVVIFLSGSMSLTGDEYEV